MRKAWARFSHELHRSPDAPYPGMADAFEQHFSQSFTDREWMAEASTWAAAWKAAKRHGAQSTPSVNEGVRKVTLGFRWESEAQHHIPTIEIEFDPVSPESPNDAKGWQDRDRIASRLSPEAKP